VLQIKSSAEGDRIRVSVIGDATIQFASDIRNKFLEILKEKKSIELDTSDLGIADVSFLQLLGSLHRSLHGKKLSLTFSNNTLSEPVRRTADQAGFFKTKISAIVPEENCPFYSVLREKE
jgi:anti-anti-sigma regulatory factor